MFLFLMVKIEKTVQPSKEKVTEILKKKYGLPPKSRISSRLMTTLCGLRISPTIQQSQTVTCPTLLSAKIVKTLQPSKEKELMMLRINHEMLFRQRGQQPWSAEKQRAFNRMVLLKQSLEEAKTQEEVEEARKKLRR